MVRTVIIGSGDIAKKRHIPGILQSGGGELHGFYNRRWERTEAAVAAWGGHGYKAFEEVLEDPQVDAVLIATPTPTHHDLTVRALRAGKHVLCEKPLALNAAEGEDMVAEAAKNGRKLMVCHVQRLYEPCRKARELIEAGELGRILSFRTFLGVKGGAAKPDANTPPWKNAVAELGTHRIDLMRYLLQTEAKRVFCALTQLDADKPDAAVVAGDDNAMAIVEYENGVYGMMAFSRTSYGGNDRTTTIFGTEGVLTLYGEKEALKLAKRDGREIIFPMTCEEQSKLEITEIHSLFFDCIQRDTQPFISGEDGLAAVKTVDAMIASSQRGAWVSL